MPVAVALKFTVHGVQVLFRTHLAGPKSFNVRAREFASCIMFTSSIFVAFECTTLKDAGLAKCVLKYLVQVT